MGKKWCVYYHKFPDNTFYIGSCELLHTDTFNNVKRWDSYGGWSNGAYNNSKIKPKVEQYTFEETYHEILLYTEDKQEARDIEAVLINDMISDSKCLNSQTPKVNNPDVLNDFLNSFSSSITESDICNKIKWECY